jgi:Protein of unknown function, DUF600
MAGRTWDEIPQEEWENIVLHVHEDGRWTVQFDYTGVNNIQYHYPEEGITWDEFYDIYDMAGELDQEIEIWADT